jgi:FPC/CPF motif-containing protein YcgG
VEPLTPAELQQRTDAVAASVRADRNARLTASDFTQLSDYSKQDQQQWKQYRQALRDVPQQAGFPRSVIWPTVPGSTPNSNGAI